jgi:hypothetical protein
MITMSAAHKNTAEVFGVGRVIPPLVEIIVRDSGENAQMFKNLVAKC